MEAIIKGVLAGLAYGLLLGPLFFLGLQVTLDKGLRNGLALAVGAFLSDFSLAALGWWSSSQLMGAIQQDFFQTGMGMIGAILIIAFGVSAVWPRNEAAKEALVAGAAKRRYSFLKGFALNMANPSNWLFWFGLAAAARADAPADPKRYTLVFLGSALAMVLSTDVAKVVLAGKIGARLRPGLPGKIVRLAGIVLIAVGAWILLKIAISRL